MYSGSVVKICIQGVLEFLSVNGRVTKAYSILEQYFEVDGVAVLFSPLKEHFS